MVKRRLILVLLISCVLLCCTAQAITLRVSVTDEKTGGALVDASVYIDGTYMGSTVSDGTYSYYHTGEKDLRLKVVRTGYKDWVEYVDSDRTSVSVKMVRKDEILTFELYDALTLQPISGALIRVEGDGISSSGTTGNDGSTDFSVKAGALYNVEVRTSGYYDLSKTVQMDSGNRVVQYWLFRSDLLAVQVRDGTTFAPIKDAEVLVDGGHVEQHKAEEVDGGRAEWLDLRGPHVRRSRGWCAELAGMRERCVGARPGGLQHLRDEPPR